MQRCQLSRILQETYTFFIDLSLSRILRNLPHYSIIIDNIGDMMRGNVNSLTVDTIKVLAQKKISHILNFRGWHLYLWATVQGYTTLSNGTSLLAIAGQWVLCLVYFEWTPILKYTCCKHMLLIAGVNLHSQPEQIETIQKHNK